MHRAMGSGMRGNFCRRENYLSTMPMPIPVPEIVERAWRDAPPGREAACQNEILREFRRLLQHSCRVDGGSSRTSVSIHGLGYLLTALRRQGLIPDELVLQLATLLRSHDLFLELRVRTPRTLTANQARQGGKQGTDGRERSRIHFRCLALTSLLRSLRPKD